MELAAEELTSAREAYYQANNEFEHARLEYNSSGIELDSLITQYITSIATSLKTDSVESVTMRLTNETL